MGLPKKPKGMKDPVAIAGKWEEREAPPETAGTTKVDVKDKELDKDHREALKGVAFKKVVKAKK